MTKQPSILGGIEKALRDDTAANICRLLHTDPGTIAKTLRRNGRDDLALPFENYHKKRTRAISIRKQLNQKRTECDQLAGEYQKLLGAAI